MLTWIMATCLLLAVGAFSIYGTLDREREEANKTKTA
jgi:hypothetical protein